MALTSSHASTRVTGTPENFKPIGYATVFKLRRAGASRSTPLVGQRLAAVDPITDHLIAFDLFFVDPAGRSAFIARTLIIIGGENRLALGIAKLADTDTLPLLTERCIAGDLGITGNKLIGLPDHRIGGKGLAHERIHALIDEIFATDPRADTGTKTNSTDHHQQ